MNTWSKSAVFAGAAFAVLGLASQALAEQILTVAETRCSKLLGPGIDELLVPRTAKGTFAGEHTQGGLTLGITVTSQSPNGKPLQFDWVSTNGSPTGVDLVIVDDDGGKISHVYPHSPKAFFNSDVTGPTSGQIVRARFCFGGPVSENAAFNQCPFTLTCTPGEGGEDQVAQYINPETGGFSDCSCVESQVCQFGSALSPCTEPGDFPLLVGWETIVSGEEEDSSHFFLYCPASTAADAECKKYFFPHF